MAEAAPHETNSQIVSLAAKPSAETIYGVGDSLWTIALRRIRRDRLTMVAIIVLVIMIVLAFSAPIFAGGAAY